MDNYNMDQLTDEVFGHLCNIAIDKCNDKTEKRRAGCGGKAMRKRVLIKNFVSELMRVQNDRDSCSDMDSSSDDLGDNSFTSSESASEDTSIAADETMDFDLEDSHVEQQQPKADCWLSGEPQLSDNHYTDYLGDSLLTSRDGAEGRAENKSSPTSSSPPDSRLGLYDLFSSVSETATEGGQPEQTTPEGYMHQVPAHAHHYDGFGSYSMTDSPYEMESLSLSSLCDMSPSPLQPVSAEASDQLFLSLNNSASYSEMKTYTPMTDALPEDVITPATPRSIHDLDSGKENLNLFGGKKRKSDDDFFLPCPVSDKRQKL